MKRYKDNFEEEYLSNPFLSYKFRFKNMTFWGKLLEILDWSKAALFVIIIIAVGLLLLGAVFGAFNVVFLGV